MNAYKLVVVMVLCGVISARGAGENELRIGGNHLSPSGDVWDPGIGASIQWRSRIQDSWAYAISLGIMNLDASTDELSGEEGAIVTGGLSGYYWGFVDSYEGDATIVPLGASLIYNIQLSQTATLSLEGGLKYVFVNSSVKANLLDGLISPVNGQVLMTDRWQEDVEIGNNLLATLGASLDIPLNESANLFLGATYQFDIIEGELEIESHWSEYDGVSVTDNELGGFFIEAGIGIDL